VIIDRAAFADSLTICRLAKRPRRQRDTPSAAQAPAGSNIPVELKTSCGRRVVRRQARPEPEPEAEVVSADEPNGQAGLVADDEAEPAVWRALYRMSAWPRPGVLTIVCDGWYYRVNGLPWTMMVCPLVPLLMMVTLLLTPALHQLRLVGPCPLCQWRQPRLPEQQRS